MPKSKLARMAVVPAALVALTLTGCAHSPSTAAVIDGHQISDSRVTEAQDALASINPQFAGEEGRSVVTVLLMRDDAADAISKSQGITVSEQERVMALGQPYPDAILSSAKLKTIYDGHLDFLVLRAKIGEPKFKQLVADLHPQMNPRYGAWNADQYAVDTSSQSLSTKYTPEQ